MAEQRDTSHRTQSTTEPQTSSRRSTSGRDDPAGQSYPRLSQQQSRTSRVSSRVGTLRSQMSSNKQQESKWGQVKKAVRRYSRVVVCNSRDTCTHILIQRYAGGSRSEANQGGEDALECSTDEYTGQHTVPFSIDDLPAWLVVVWDLPIREVSSSPK